MREILIDSEICIYFLLENDKWIMRKDNDVDLYGIVYVSFPVWLSFLAVVFWDDDKFRLFSLTLIFPVCPFLVRITIFFVVREESNTQWIVFFFFVSYLSWNAINSTSLWCMSYARSMSDECLFNREKNLQVKKEKRRKREGARERENERKKNIVEQAMNAKREREKICIRKEVSCWPAERERELRLVLMLFDKRSTK